MKSPSGFLWKNPLEKRNLTYLLLFGDLPHAAAAPAAGEIAEGLGQRKRRIRRNGIPGRIPAGGAYRPDRGKGL